jgi:hypothetical protein
MIIVIKDTCVYATHSDTQKQHITTSLYPDADSIKMIIDTDIAIGDPDPTILHPEYLIQDFATIQEGQDWTGSILATITPSQAVQWIDDNVNTLADAKDALKIIVRAVILLRNRTT